MGECLKIQKRQLIRNEVVAFNFIILGISLHKLKELGALDDYIKTFYDTLHTQGKTYIVDSLLEYIYHRDPQWLPKDYRPFQISTNEGGKSC